LARYTGFNCRICRREMTKLYLKGDRCYTDKCAVERRNYPPGQHGQSRGKLSDYGLQLREKQKIRRMYGLGEKQFKSYFKEADRQKGVTGTNFWFFSNVDWTTPFTALGSPTHEIRLDSWSATATCWSTASGWTSPPICCALGTLLPSPKRAERSLSSTKHWKRSRGEGSLLGWNWTKQGMRGSSRPIRPEMT